MFRLKPALAAAALLGLAFFPTGPASIARAADYPAKVVTLVVAFPPGSSTDVIARLISEKLSQSMGQTFIVENRPGAGGNIGTNAVLRTAHDGYTLLVHSSAYAVNPSLYGKAGYDPLKDFTPIALAATTPNMLFAYPGLKAKTLAEVVALAKTQPLSYASSGSGTTPHLAAELLFRTLAKVDVTHVPFGPAEAVTAVMGDQVPLGSTSMPAAVRQVKAGKLRAIAVMSARRNAAFPDVPTVAESGYPDFEAATWFAFFAPAKVPAEIVERLNVEINRALRLPDVKARLEALAFESAPNTSAEFAAYLAGEVEKWSKVVAQSGARAD